MKALVAAACIAAAVFVPAGAAAPTLKDGRHFGYVRALDAKQLRLAFDRADFLTGDAATRAARRAGIIGPGETPPNDYFIVNSSKRRVWLTIARSVVVTHVQCKTGCKEKLPGTLAGLARSFHDNGDKTLEDPYRGANTQYWLTLRAGKVVRIDELYLP